ncbi:hypothetical protein MTR67_021721 [Solanum verrucosum]|uniref:Uncharacterized protein n=1 Tax=Solanum verrucosum TaxID=315347 RepID=A0AAF0QS05_SOLVR|nr:hypothetical protein MTR67_021721 [Solanum verrucosum]
MATLGLNLYSPSMGHQCILPKSQYSPSKFRISCSSLFLQNNKFKREYTSVMIVPTGVGAAIGGYAGDALPVARALSSVVDCLISHPNVLNAAMLYWPMPNALYVEGYALDRFAEGLWALQPVHQNRVGLVFDAGIEEELLMRHLQVVDATRASLGLPIVGYTVTDTPLLSGKVWEMLEVVQRSAGGQCYLTPADGGRWRYSMELVEVEKWVDPTSGQSTGRIQCPDSLLRAVESLRNECKVDALAVVARFPDDDIEDLDDYRQGVGIDLLAGVEAVISHLVVKNFHIPCAHAPAVLPPQLNMAVCPKSAAEEIGFTFLPCVLAGLSTAPQYLVKGNNFSDNCIVAGDVDSVILPIDACRGDGALAFANRKINKVIGSLSIDINWPLYLPKAGKVVCPSPLPSQSPLMGLYWPLIIAVEENQTVLNDTPDSLGIEAVKVSNYWEAIGVIAAHKAGIDPNSLRRNRINNITPTTFVPSNGYAKSSIKSFV